MTRRGFYILSLIYLSVMVIFAMADKFVPGMVISTAVVCFTAGRVSRLPYGRWIGENEKPLTKSTSPKRWGR
jgi:uncharacterized membrane protein YedE/YeeE